MSALLLVMPILLPMTATGAPPGNIKCTVKPSSSTSTQPLPLDHEERLASIELIHGFLLPVETGGIDQAGDCRGYLPFSTRTNVSWTKPQHGYHFPVFTGHPAGVTARFTETAYEIGHPGAVRLPAEEHGVVSEFIRRKDPFVLDYDFTSSCRNNWCWAGPVLWPVDSSSITMMAKSQLGALYDLPVEICVTQTRRTPCLACVRHMSGKEHPA